MVQRSLPVPHELAKLRLSVLHDADCALRVHAHRLRGGSAAHLADLLCETSIDRVRSMSKGICAPLGVGPQHC